MTLQDLYRSRLANADDALSFVRSDMNIAMGMAVAEPPALLSALARKVENASIETLRLWYFHSLDAAANSVLRPDMLDRVRPHCMFLSHVERTLRVGFETHADRANRRNMSMAAAA